MSYGNYVAFLIGACVMGFALALSCSPAEGEILKPQCACAAMVENVLLKEFPNGARCALIRFSNGEVSTRCDRDPGKDSI